MSFKSPIPIVRIFDEAKAKAFYVDFLGFVINWEHRFASDLPLYCQVSLAGCVLHFSEHSGDGTPGSIIRVPCDDLAGYGRKLNAASYKYARPGIQKQPWDYFEMPVRDPFSNTLVFCQPI